VSLLCFTPTAVYLVHLTLLGNASIIRKTNEKFAALERQLQKFKVKSEEREGILLLTIKESYPSSFFNLANESLRRPSEPDADFVRLNFPGL
jgi:hypothetical protein